MEKALFTIPKIKEQDIAPLIGNYRWTICGLVFFATTINYLDRAVISLLKTRLGTELNWTETD